MKNVRIYPAGTTEAIACAVGELGTAVTGSPTPDTTHLLLDVPQRQGNPEEILEKLPRDITIIGGHLDFPGYSCLDLLQDEEYLAKNAAITAHCAVKLALQHLPITLEGCPVLILGWGRIGKCLGKLLQAMGAHVTIAARRPAQRGMLRALGYRSADYSELPEALRSFRLIYNTVPVKILSEDAKYGDASVAIELSSIPALPGAVIDGRGLPARLAPESSGKLIAQTIFRRL